MAQRTPSLHERSDDQNGGAVFPGHELPDGECHVRADIEATFAVGREEVESRVDAHYFLDPTFPSSVSTTPPRARNRREIFSDALARHHRSR
jgi:hypothetical protein